MRSINRFASALITIAILTGCVNAIEETSRPVATPTSRGTSTGTPLADNTPIPSATPTNIAEPTIESLTLTPESLITFNVCRTRDEAVNCPITQEDVDSGAFVKFAKTIDDTTFPPDVIFPPMLTLNGPPGHFKQIFWRDVDGSDEALTAFYKANPDKLNQRVVCYGRSEMWGYPTNIKIVKVLNPDGSTVYLQYYSPTSNESPSRNNVSTWPLVESESWQPYSDPTIKPLLLKWVETGNVPTELEDKTLVEMEIGGQ